MTFGLDAMIRALTASRLGIETASHNVANAATPGYSRQRVLLSSSLPYLLQGRFQVGTGVEIAGINSIVDDGVEMRLRMQRSAVGQTEIEVGRWAEIEGLFNEPNGGLSTQLSDFFGKVGQLQTDASSRSLRGGFVQSAKALAANLNLLANRIDSLHTDTGLQVAGLVRDVNQHAKAVADLNRQIVALEANGSRANDLRDAREEHLKQIADSLDIRTIERDNGAVDVMADGKALVAGTRASTLASSLDATGTTHLTLGKSGLEVQPRVGKIAGLLAQDTGDTAKLRADLDALAHSLALEVNRIQTTGVPGSGPFTTLTSWNAVQDSDGDGNRGNELLSQSGLPFTVQKGELFVSVINAQTGALQRTKIAIDPATMTLEEFATALENVDQLSATVDPTGRLRINADTGYAFDFASRLDDQPDAFGSFGGKSPSVATLGVGPFDFSTALATGPAAFTVTIDGAPVNVSVTAAEFQNPAAVTVDELVTAINTDLGNAATAANVGGRLVLRSNSQGTAATLGLTDGAGAPLATLGLPTGATRNGQNTAVAPKITGTYSGTSNGQLVFVPDADGQIGVTPGLTISVYDTAGTRVAKLDVGPGYSPGTDLDVADGVKVSFAGGQVSATFRDVFALDTLADSDTTDILAALGLNALYHGSTAADLSVDAGIERDPDLLALGLTGAPSDAGNVTRLLNLRTTEVLQLGDTIEGFYTGIVGGIGFESAAAQASQQAQDQLLAALQQQRDSVSGVSIDEEMVDLVRFQQAFDAAARFVSVVSDLSQTLVNLGR